MTKELLFELPYWISNNGDGSASTHFVASKEEAEKKDEEQAENGDGWGESCNGSVAIKVVDNKLYIREFQKVDGKYQYVWIEVKQS